MESDTMMASFLLDASIVTAIAAVVLFITLGLGTLWNKLR
jgi:hypothetical protein